ncbi:MAG TPA: hypothetical protein VJ729_06475 [Nitrososphaeraceae archaeon]|nr:hypothetical protein [Nitrososphaeraceae archaeon]
MERVESDRSDSAVTDEYSQPATIIIKQLSAWQQIRVMDVYGHQIEPICNYRNCHHK